MPGIYHCVVYPSNVRSEHLIRLMEAGWRICALYTESLIVRSHITEIIVITCLKCQEIVKHLPPYSRFKSYVFWLPAWWALWLLWWPLTDAAMFQCVYGYLQSVFLFLVLFHCCILLEIKLTTSTICASVTYSTIGSDNKFSPFQRHDII